MLENVSGCMKRLSGVAPTDQFQAECWGVGRFQFSIEATDMVGATALETNINDVLYPDHFGSRKTLKNHVLPLPE